MKKNNKKSLLGAGISLSFLTLLSRITGLFRETTKAAFLGTSDFADAFGIAFMIPNLFRRLFAENAISVAFIPTFREFLCHDDEKKSAIQFVRATLTLLTFLTSIIVALGIVFAPKIVPFFFNEEANPKVLLETTILTRIMFPYLFLISLAAFFQGILNGIKIFSPSGFTPVLFNLCVIFCTIFLSNQTQNPVRAMAFGVVLGGIVQVVFQLPFVVHSGWAKGFSSIKSAFLNDGTKKVALLIAPTILGMAAYQLNDLVSTALAGKAGTGVVSALQYSLRLQELILGIFAVSIGTVILPDLSALAKEKKWHDFYEMFLLALKIIALISISVTFYALLSGHEIISLVYKSRSFSEESVFLTLSAFCAHILGLFFIATNRIVSPAFYAQSDSKSPTIAGIAGFAVNIVLVLIFSKNGAAGIAFALTIASAFNTIFLFIFFAHKNKSEAKFVIFNFLGYSVKIVIFSALAIFPSFFVHKFFVSVFKDATRFFAFGMPLFFSAITFFTIFFAILFFTKDEILKKLFSRIFKKA